MDEDLAQLDRHALIAEVKRLRAGIREHRDSSGHERTNSHSTPFLRYHSRIRSKTRWSSPRSS
jgi:hypothetical protein